MRIFSSTWKCVRHMKRTYWNLRGPVLDLLLIFACNTERMCTHTHTHSCRLHNTTSKTGLPPWTLPFACQHHSTDAPHSSNHIPSTPYKSQANYSVVVEEVSHTSTWQLLFCFKRCIPQFVSCFLVPMCGSTLKVNLRLGCANSSCGGMLLRFKQLCRKDLT